MYIYLLDDSHISCDSYYNINLSSPIKRKWKAVTNTYIIEVLTTIISSGGIPRDAQRLLNYLEITDEYIVQLKRFSVEFKATINGIIIASSYSPNGRFIGKGNTYIESLGNLKYNKTVIFNYLNRRDYEYRSRTI